MKRVQQRRCNQVDGDCLQACLASIFEVPLDELPEDHTDDMPETLALFSQLPTAKAGGLQPGFSMKLKWITLRYWRSPSRMLAAVSRLAHKEAIKALRKDGTL